MGKEGDLAAKDIEDFVKSAYLELLGRDPEEKGFLYWVGRLSQGYTDKAFLLDLIRSEEFTKRTKQGSHGFQQDDDIHSDDTFMGIYGRCEEFTMTSIYNTYALYNAIRYVVTTNIPGDFVECGVWRGGSAMVAAMTFLEMGDHSRKLFLYDTYEGMTQPTDHDVRNDGIAAGPLWAECKTEKGSTWALASLEEVKNNVAMTGYPEDKIEFVCGRVEKTIPSIMPDDIAVLRLDTDWFESTLHELTHLYPCLHTGGVLIVDDYGWWKGCRAAVDSYFSLNHTPLLLNRICPSGTRVAIKI